MDKDTLLQRQADLVERFKTVQNELLRIEGEHRLITDLIAQLEPQKPSRMRKERESQEDAQD